MSANNEVIIEGKRPISFHETFSQKIMPKIYGFGAAIAIMGAMFKLLSLPGGNFMLGAGLSTEAFIFFISAFEKPAKEFDWSIIFPQLDKDYAFRHGYMNEHGVIDLETVPAPSFGGSAPVQHCTPVSRDGLSDLLSKCNVDQDYLNKLGAGIKNLTSVCSEIGNFSKVAVDWDSFSQNFSKANISLSKIAEMGTSLNGALEKVNADFSLLVSDGGVAQIKNQTMGINEGLTALNTKILELNKSYDNVLRALRG